MHVCGSNGDNQTSAVLWKGCMRTAGNALPAQLVWTRLGINRCTTGAAAEGQVLQEEDFHTAESTGSIASMWSGSAVREGCMLRLLEGQHMF